MGHKNDIDVPYTLHQRLRILWLLNYKYILNAYSSQFSLPARYVFRQRDDHVCLYLVFGIPCATGHYTARVPVCKVAIHLNLLVLLQQLTHTLTYTFIRWRSHYTDLISVTFLLVSFFHITQCFNYSFHSSFLVLLLTYNPDPTYSDPQSLS